MSAAKSSQPAGMTSMRLSMISWSMPWILHFVQNDKSGWRTSP
jgi:hypothetical protein